MDGTGLGVYFANVWKKELRFAKLVGVTVALSSRSCV
jgi:hypothetical protein